MSITTAPPNTSPVAEPATIPSVANVPSVASALTPPPGNGIWNVDAETYHANRTHINHSALTVFKRSVPEYADIYVHGTLQPAVNDAMLFGSALHSWLLEGEDQFWNTWCVSQKFDRRSKEGKAAAARFEWDNRGKAYINIEEFDMIQAMCRAAHSNPQASALLQRPGDVEQTLCWTDPYTQIPCKARFDKVTTVPYTGEDVIVDVKTTTDPNPEAWAKAVINFQYHRQAAWYLEARRRVLESSGNRDPFADNVGETRFLFIVIGKNAPHECIVYELDEPLLRLGRQENGRLLNELQRRRARGDWSSRYNGMINTVVAPAWLKGIENG